MKLKYFAGIGSRKYPKKEKEIIKSLAYDLVNLGYILRSGGASGADSYWEEYYDLYGGQKEIYLPFKDFNKNKSPFFGVSEAALNLAEKYHPKWSACSPIAKLLHARNGYQVLGNDLKTPVDFIICWTPDGLKSGGAAQATRIAEDKHIPIYNIKNINELHQIQFVLSSEKIMHSI